MQKGKVLHKGKTKIWIGSMLAAFMAAIGVFLMMMQMEENLLLKYEKGVILAADKDIPKGQMITDQNASVYFREIELDKNCIPRTALNSLEQIKDMVSKTDIEKGVLLTSGMFEEMEKITADMSNPVIAGFKAEDLYQVVGGVLRTGDRINIYSVEQDGEVCLRWRNVFVQQVFDNTGICIEGGDTQTAAQRINVYLEENNVEQFYRELTAGTLRVVKVCNF